MNTNDEKWRWLCVECNTEGRGNCPQQCLTCGRSDSWYINNAHANDPRSMREIMNTVIFSQLQKPTEH